MRYKFNPERLAYWYLRLNGFLTIENFIVHDEGGLAQRTDVDLIGLRFPHRREAYDVYGNAEHWMNDDQFFASRKKPFAIFVEVATGQCKLNGPWTTHAKNNMPRAIRAMGLFASAWEVEAASQQVYATGRYLSAEVELGLASIGERPNPKLAAQFPSVIQITWRNVTDFIFDRFAGFERIKRDHSQWDMDGHLLWRMFRENRGDKEAFGSSFVLIAAKPNADEIERYRLSQIYPLNRLQGVKDMG
jgi:hypothetical protein